MRKRKRRHGKVTDKSSTRCAPNVDRPPTAEHEIDPTHQTLDCTSTLDVNFHDFAERYPDFREAWDVLKQRRRGETLSESSSPRSFSTHVDSAFNVALTRAILCHNFDLSLPSMPEGYLCPPVPNRLNYVLWLNHLLEQTSDAQYFQQEPSPSDVRQTRIGIDIGCGASCIYPLLLTTDRFNPTIGKKCADNDNSECASRWTFLATDIDEQSLQSAAINVKANSLEGRIELALVPKSRRQMLEEESDANTLESGTAHVAFSKSTPGPVMNAIGAYAQVVDSKKTKGKSINNGPAKFDFCMTNPPFYATEEEATADRKGDGRSRTDMSVGEGVYPGGGEIQFVGDMIADSLELTDSVTWYTSMVSKKSSLVELKQKLRSQLGRGAVRTATFVQGKTRRWGIAWTYREVAPRSPALRLTGGLREFDVEILTTSGLGAIDEVVDRVIAYCQWMGESKKLEVECKVGKKDGKNAAKISVTSTDHGGKGDQGGNGATTSDGSIGGAFIIDISMKNIEANEVEVDSNAGSKSLVRVKLQCYCHSSSGLAAIDIFRSSLEGEIKRCNRRWRRMMTS